MSEHINTLIQYKEEYPLIENMKMNLKIKMNSEITTIMILNNNKDIAVCLTNGFLYVYDIKTFKKKLEIRPTDKTILDIVKIEDNSFCISCFDFKIRFIKFYNNNTQYKIIQELIDHKYHVNCLKKSLFFKEQIILFSSSNDGRVLSWKYDRKNELFALYQEYKIYEVEQMNMDEELQIEALEESIKYKKLICAASSKTRIYFCDLNNFSLIEKINMSVNRCIRALKIIDNDILLIAGHMEINVLNIKNKLIIKTIVFLNICEFNCIFQKRNGNILISEYSDFEKFSKIYEYKFNKESLDLILVSSRNKDFKKYITTFVETFDGHLISGGYNCEIKVYK